MKRTILAVLVASALILPSRLKAEESPSISAAQQQETQASSSDTASSLSIDESSQVSSLESGAEIAAAIMPQKQLGKAVAASTKSAKRKNWGAVALAGGAVAAAVVVLVLVSRNGNHNHHSHN